MKKEDIEQLKNDPTSIIGQVMKFNEENKNNPDMKGIFKIDEANANIEKMLMKNGRIAFMHGTEDDAGNDDGKSTCLDFQRLYNNKTKIFEAFYSQTVNTTQRPSEKDARANQKTAYTAAFAAEAIRKGEKLDAAKQDEIMQKVEEHLKQSGYDK